MRATVWLLGLVGCVKAPGWVEECGCEPGQVCRADAGDDQGLVSLRCVPVPDACAAVFRPGCGGDFPDDACVEALCGEVVPSHQQDCWSQSGEDYFQMSCTADAWW